MENNDDPSLLIAKAASHDKPPGDDDRFSESERDKISSDQRKLEIEIRAQQLAEDRENHNLRKSYANKIFWLISVWLSCVIMALMFSGFEVYTQFNLPNYVLIAFVITTTINVVGLFAIVAKWMFQPQNKK